MRCFSSLHVVPTENLLHSGRPIEIRLDPAHVQPAILDECTDCARLVHHDVYLTGTMYYMPKILTGHLQLLDRVPCQVVLILCVCIKMVSSLPLGCWCRDQGRGANSCQRHGTTQSGVIARPYWDVGTRGLIFFNFSFGDRSGQTASEKPCEILLLDVQWKLVFGTQSKLGEGGTNRLSGGHRTF